MPKREGETTEQHLQRLDDEAEAWWSKKAAELDALPPLAPQLQGALAVYRSEIAQIEGDDAETRRLDAGSKLLIAAAKLIQANVEYDIDWEYAALADNVLVYGPEDNWDTWVAAGGDVNRLPEPISSYMGYDHDRKPEPLWLVTAIETNARNSVLCKAMERGLFPL